MTRIYRLLLALYPSQFRAEFGQEMQDVFATALTEVQHRGGEQSWRLFWREIRAWPGSVLREHLRERKTKMLSSKFDEEKPLSRSELLAAMIVFLLPLLFGIFEANAIRLPQWMTPLELVLFLGPMLFALGLAVIKGLPRWSLSYLGFVLTLGIIFSRYDRLWVWIYPYFTKSYGPRSLWPFAVHLEWSRTRNISVYHLASGIRPGWKPSPACLR